jgi:hypothetical protein
MAVKDYPSQENYGRIGYVVLNGAYLGSYIIVRDCPFCGQEARTVVSGQGLWDWEHGSFVQTAFPDLTPDEREQITSGTHGPCWDAMFADEDD